MLSSKNKKHARFWSCTADSSFEGMYFNVYVCVYLLVWQLRFGRYLLGVPSPTSVRLHFRYHKQCCIVQRLYIILADGRH